MAETIKAQPRREREGFFEKYCQGNGIDIGAGNDPLVTPFGTVRGFDRGDGDAQTLDGIADESFDFVYSSHCLEHLQMPHEALWNWFRVLKPGGHLIVCVPHRDLYEKKRLLPSVWNQEHASFWLPLICDPPHTWGLLWFLREYLTPDRFELIELITCNEGWFEVPVEVHSSGEYQIECIIKKL